MKLAKDLKPKKFTILDDNLILRKDLNSYEKIIYIVLLKYSNEESYCFPSYKTISEGAGCSLSTVKKTIKSLEDKGLIKKVSRKIKDKKENNSNLYYVMAIENNVGCETTKVGREKTGCEFPRNLPVGCEKTGNDIKLNHNKYNNYLDLSFLELNIENVKITNDSYKSLIDKFGKKLTHNKIVDLDTYIANGNGKKYKDHGKVLFNWCLKEDEKRKSKDPLRYFKKL